MKKIKILLTTYNREDLLLLLLQDILLESAGFDISLLIINDCSQQEYIRVKNFLRSHFPDRHDYFENRVNNGKKYYCKTTGFAYLKLASHNFDYLVQLPDDIRLVKGFFSKATDTWDAIDDPRKACLSIAANYSRLMSPQWTTYVPHIVSFGETELIKTGWVDMCFIADKAYLEALYYTIDPVSIRWSGNAELSSGVGMQISRRLINGGHSIYCVKRSLVIHDHHPSVMHPKHRECNVLVTNHDMPAIIATMATMPGREASMEEAIRSIIDQVDELWIYANNFDDIPLKYHHNKIKWFLSSDHLGDLGDAGKFYKADKINGYHFTIDDDLIYPPDYVATMIAAIERYERLCAISCHGRVMPAGKVASYYRNALSQFACLRTVPKDAFAHIVGTGVLAYYTGTISIPLSAFETANMADIWFSKYCQGRSVPRVVIKHRSRWLIESNNYDQQATIHYNNVNNDKFQTQIVNSVRWTAP